MRRHQNQNSQPFREMPVFQNWDIAARAWYYACRSRDIPAGRAKSLNLCGQHVVIFRGEDGGLRAMDGFCPHMGTDLGIGRVTGNRITCFFHHWEFGGDGRCRRIPCGEPPPKQARLQVYAVREKYGAIWVFPDREADFPLPEYDEFDGAELRVAFGKAYERSCHHHVTMINGIDSQHLRTVHGFDIDMQLNIRKQRSDLIDFSLEGRLPDKRLRDRLIRKLLGPRYGYAMRYSAGSIGLLTIAQHLRLFGRFRLPALHMIFAYRPLEFGRTLVQPIYLARKRGGVFGWLRERLLIWTTRRAFYALQDEDGKVYDNMRFNPVSLISMDRPIVEFIKTVNQLKPSGWSIAPQTESETAEKNSAGIPGASQPAETAS